MPTRAETAWRTECASSLGVGLGVIDPRVTAGRIGTSNSSPYEPSTVSGPNRLGFHHGRGGRVGGSRGPGAVTSNRGLSQIRSSEQLARGLGPTQPAQARRWPVILSSRLHDECL